MSFRSTQLSQFPALFVDFLYLHLFALLVTLSSSANGWPRAIARNGVHLMDEWNVQLTNVTFADTPHPPMSQARPTKLRVYLPDGRERNLDISNVSLA